MNRGRYRILLVDDDEVDRMALLRDVRTQSLPFDCQGAASLAEAREALASASFDVIVLDRELPDGLGFELLPYVPATPVIFVTGSDSPEDAVRAMKAGAADYLIKDPDRTYLKLLPIAIERALRQHRERAALRETQELFRQTFNEAPIGIAFISPGGGFLRVNQALCDIFGLPEIAFLTGGFERVFQALPESGCMAEFGSNRKIERLSRRGDGTSLWLQLDIAHVPDCRGLEATYVAQIQDISDRKRAEAALERSHAELLELSRRAGMAEVAAGVLHNVANVLVGVNQTSAVLQEEMANSKAEHLRSLVGLLDQHKDNLGAYLKEDETGKQVLSFLTRLSERLAGERSAALKELASLRESVVHLMAIIRAQQSQGRAKAEPQKIAVADLITNALRLGSAAAHPEVRTVKEVPAGLTMTVDLHRVLQILVNLIRNSIQACECSEGAEKIVTVRACSAGGRVRIVVSDTGAGIDPAHLPRLFSHGFSTKRDGHGFGLHSSRVAAEELGGELSVHSEGPGRGAKFTLELPA